MDARHKPPVGGKILLSLGFIIASAAYAVWQQMSGRQAAVSPSEQFRSANETFLQVLSQMTQTPATSSPAAPQSTAHVGAYLDGSYIGNPADAYYGTVQVRVVIKNGLIADVQFLQHPDNRQNSVYINDQAMPLLTQEAIRAQNAQVDGVSGATFTSHAFRDSLASALAKAK